MTSSYSLTAQNTDPDSENRIHADDVARRFGFRGGLVPGATVYRHLCPALVVALGEEWLERGGTTVRFLKPVYDGDRITVAGELLADGGARVTVTNEAGDTCAVAEAAVRAAIPAPPAPSAYADGPPPAERPEATPESLAPGTDLGVVEVTAGPDEAHPAELLRLANRIFVANFRVSPWIHASSRIQHHGEIRAGTVLQARGRVTAQHERRGHRLVDLDVLVLAGGQPAGQVTHTAIYELAPASPG